MPPNRRSARLFSSHPNCDFPIPSTASECAPPPPQSKGGGLDTLRRPGEGVGESKFGRLEKTPSSLFILSNVQKNKKSANQKNLTVHCTVYSVHWLYGITPAACQNESIPYDECTRSHQLRTMTLRSCINSVKSLYAITPTPYIECTQLVQKILRFNWMKVTLRNRQTAYIHCTELV